MKVYGVNNQEIQFSRVGIDWVGNTREDQITSIMYNVDVKYEKQITFTAITHVSNSHIFLAGYSLFLTSFSQRTNFQLHLQNIPQGFIYYTPLNGLYADNILLLVDSPIMLGSALYFKQINNNMNLVIYDPQRNNSYPQLEIACTDAFT